MCFGDRSRSKKCFRVSLWREAAAASALLSLLVCCLSRKGPSPFYVRDGGPDALLLAVAAVAATAACCSCCYCRCAAAAVLGARCGKKAVCTRVSFTFAIDVAASSAFMSSVDENLLLLYSSLCWLTTPRRMPSPLHILDANERCQNAAT